MMKSAPHAAPRAPRVHATHRVKLAPTATMRFDPPSFSATISGPQGEKKLWVEGGLPDEEVDVRMLRRNQFTGTYDTLATNKRDGLIQVKVVAPSPLRVKPPCPVQQLCGGCPLMHLEPKAQLRYKEQVLLSALKEVGVSPRQVMPPLDLPENSYLYRHKARLSVSARAMDTKGVFVGFRERLHTRRLGFVPVVNMDRCDVLAPPLTNIIKPLRHLIAQFGSRAQTIPTIEVAVGDNISALVFRTLHSLRREEEDLLTFFGDQHKVQIYVQPGGPDSIVLLRSENGIMKRPLSVHHAAAWYKFALKVGLPNDITLHFLPNDFMQVNTHMNRVLVKNALDLLQPNSSDIILDLFSGVGNFSLTMARQAKNIYGVELVATLVHRAQENARLNNLKNVHFRTMDLYKDVPYAKQMLTHEDYTKVLLDPPRSGAYEVCQILGSAAKASQVLYVSCNPLTFARDAQALVESKKYRLESVGVANMFPHTGHVESMAVFVK